ncbi:MULTISPECIES: DNA-binding protein [Pasteurellaceae]|uniref:HTH Mu-type domain-containing protein n=3 Tax=Pasteurellaceae TaxID=712 RepID=A0A4P7CI05_9PAST|nr:MULTISPECIES: DNA-binding protein [Pasteurellaceae]MCU9999548.1 hypothetical protein [[Pasteurella] aerogenes]QOF66841.1 hypothetical protein IFE17_06525 [Actinobacillus sp. GY-402]QRX38475.1 hypothetical protein [Actinobacillus sp.]KEZ23010.1 Mu DNA-binding domain protein [Glaesserella parasuis]MCT8560534.1 hypothetical protein [Glaesserella parasuis]
MKEWYTLKELLAVGGLPSTPQGIILYAKRDKWRRRRVAGVKGNIFEYYVYDMPKSVQCSLGVTQEALLQQEVIDDIQKENENFLNKILSDIKNVLVNNGVSKIRENSSVTKEEEALLSYYRKSSEKDKTIILNMAETIYKTSNN